MNSDARPLANGTQECSATERKRIVLCCEREEKNDFVIKISYIDVTVKHNREVKYTP